MMLAQIRKADHRFQAFFRYREVGERVQRVRTPRVPSAAAP